MFNNLDNQTNPSRQPVDDIFAETDRPSAGAAQSDIETHNVGLASANGSLPSMETEPVSGGRNYLKIVIIITLSIAFLGGVYLAYTQFFKNSGKTDENIIIPNQEPKTDVKAVVSTSTGSEFVTEIPGVSTTTISPVEIATSSEASSSSVIIASSTEESEAPVVSLVDSDSDSLTDAEEIAAGTNLNVIDTDNDGLSDYEEVKIYKTNPLSADTDGDGYLDGAEVKSGYNPNGPGKLPGSLLE